MRILGLALSIALLAGCASGPRIDSRYAANGQNSRVQYIVLHYTSTDLPRSLRLLTEEDVSSHYLIGDAPATIFRLVDENRRAWHAGDSQWQGRTWLNGTSIGIELVNRGYSDGPDGRHWQPYAPAQIEALVELLKDIVQRHQLAPGSILAHSDVAPQRKVDPGPLFPWKRLADAGLLPWPDAQAVAQQQALFSQSLPTVAWFQQQLQRQGYLVPAHGELDQATRNVLAAFQMKYRQARYDGEPDAETAALLLVLNGQP
ncbi:N-acetylmuramoyl-L-alanine amidase [Pseudomonas sp. sp1636]|uniref:N-acetylmuramoyl-L-alanine amidase n=1 Tax=Pseudomonas sp. sp1636 TaxID=3036707 RepID=UPI0025A677E6|nr:N-acetylmuramoyl-L-alanine amidase [Pseudomonas sp. sp1636]MDM8348896.1 N-acetylmuramoyl-L-alanine amidase [Pseudomonas sp. sp1636]